MKNPSEYKFILMAALFPIGGLVSTLWLEYFDNHRWIPGAISTAIGLVFLSFFIVVEVIYRPYEVEVGETVVLKYHGWTREYEVEWLECVLFSPTHSSKYWPRRIDSKVKFTLDRNAIQVTYEVAMAMYNAYQELMGKTPPLAPGSATIEQ